MDLGELLSKVLVCDGIRVYKDSMTVHNEEYVGVISECPTHLMYSKVKHFIVDDNTLEILLM